MKTTCNILFFFITALCLSQTVVKAEMRILEGTQMTSSDAFHIAPSAQVINDGKLLLKEDLINNGVFSYTLTNTESAVHFTGDLQQILGDQTSVFYNVLFNNTTTILKGSIQVDNDADFTRGIVENELAGGLFFFNDLSDHINTSNLSFVHGTVLKNGNLDFTLPIGTANQYRPASIENLTGENRVSGCYFLQDSNGVYPHDAKEGVIDFIDNKEYWELKRLEGTDFAMVTLSRNAATSSSEIMNASLNALHIVRWDIDKNYWVDEGGIAMPNSDAIKTITNVTGYGIFALAVVRTDAILPGDVVVYNNLTPNGDGINDTLFITGIERFPDNIVRIFNRWGAKVSEIHGYNNEEKVFKGYANSSSEDQSSELLPSGTYYYILEYSVAGERIKKINYLFIN